MHIEERQTGENGRDYALRILKENIIDLELKPGSMVSEKELAAELGLSRTPVREALLDLANVQMVEVFPQRGIRIMLSSYSIHFDRIREMALHSVKELKIVNDHKRMCAAIQQHDDALAQELMEEHLERYRLDEKEIRENYPAEYFV